MARIFRLLFFTVLLGITGTKTAVAQGHILVQSTTSTQNSGLYDYLLPKFSEETGIEVRIVAVGTGQAIRNAMNGDADVLLVHAKEAEQAFVASGYGVERFNLMYNDFVIVGPLSDASEISKATNLTDAMMLLSKGTGVFVSRGDDSGTHMKEGELWNSIGFTPAPSTWYRETGAGMGATLRTTIEMQGYTLTDRATWIAYKSKRDAKIVFEGDSALYNQYGIIAVNPDTHPHANSEGASVFIEWMLGDRGQSLIASYTRDGQQLFFPNAK